MGERDGVDKWLLRILYVCLIVLAMLFIAFSLFRLVDGPQ